MRRQRGGESTADADEEQRKHAPTKNEETKGCEYGKHG
jgi:hypothetical protein